MFSLQSAGVNSTEFDVSEPDRIADVSGGRPGVGTGVVGMYSCWASGVGEDGSFH